MKLVAFCIRYPVTVIVGMILALLFGVIALARLPIQMTPTVERPEISVETVYRGAAPQEVEKRVLALKALAKHIYNARDVPGRHRTISGAEQVEL